MMKLGELLEHYQVKQIKGTTDIEVTGLTEDSRQVRPGSVFFAIKGEAMDGNRFVPDAIHAGAVAVVTENEPIEQNVTIIQVDEVLDALSYMADRFYGHPSGRLSLTGITGTNGKTTTAFLIYQMLCMLGKKTGLIGTIRYLIGERTYPARLTTPSASEFQRLLSEMVKEEVEFAISEVSSHALSQKRVDYTEFQLGVFTNLSHDHLDYHGNIENYYSAKERLFNEFDLKGAVINLDDPYGKRLFELCRTKGIDVITYGLSEGATLQAKEIDVTERGTSFVLQCDEGLHGVKSSLLGIANVYNLLSSIATMKALGFGVDRILPLVHSLKPAEGRMEMVDEGQPFTVLVDYAHTPDALKKLLETVRGFSAKRVITLFGCGGNRDREKRALMGGIATELSDFVFITSDNPRYEEPERIIEDILGGVSSDNYEVVVDRAEAIKRAVSICEEDDVLVVAGKGHEDYQEIKGKRIPFDDREQIRRALRERAERVASDA